MLSKNLAIIIFGHSLQTVNLLDNKKGPKNRDWQYLVWGDSKKNMLGRVPKGILLALQNKATALIFGTGATWVHYTGTTITRQEYDSLKRSEKNNYLSEAEFTMECLKKNFYQLTGFSSLSKEIQKFKSDLTDACNFIGSISITESDSFDTKTLIKNCLRICSTKGIENVCLVSNPSHLQRIITLANAENTSRKKPFANIFPIGCDTDFAVAGESTVVFEPHTGPLKRPSPFETDVFGEYQLLPPAKQESCLQEIQSIIAKYSS